LLDDHLLVLIVDDKAINMIDQHDRSTAAAIAAAGGNLHAARNKIIVDR
jgi:hypothetical protein